MYILIEKKNRKINNIQLKHSFNNLSKINNNINYSNNENKEICTSKNKITIPMKYNLFSQLSNIKTLNLKNSSLKLNYPNIMNEKEDNNKFQKYFNDTIKNPSWYNYFHYKLFDNCGEEVSKLNNYAKNIIKIK